MNSETHAPAGEERGDHGAYWPPSAEWALVYVTIILVAATFALWLATRKLVIDAKENAQQQLRAYIAVTKTRLLKDSATAPTAVVEITNTGQTPARQMTALVDGAMFGSSDHPDRRPPPSVAQSTGTLGAKGKAELMIKTIAPLPPHHTNWVWGEVLYKDVFGQARVTKFCLFDDGSGSTEERLFAVCTVAGHNDAD